MAPSSGAEVQRQPVHIGIIMDGNGRWAQKRNLIRSAGHREGLEAAKRVVSAAADRGIPYLTLYTFSTENWKRTADEVGFLMGLIRAHLVAELNFYRDHHIRIRHAGDAAGLTTDIRGELEKIVAETSSFDGTCLTLAINYGGRDEVVRSVNRWLQVPRHDGAELNSDAIAAHLDNPEVPDPDLVIRTGGEQRMSNFLLWQAAYAELYFSEKLWPDWNGDDLDLAIDAYARRDRRFGGVK